MMVHPITVEQLQEHVDFMLFSIGQAAGQDFANLKEVQQHICDLKHKIDMLKVDLILEKETNK